MDRFGVVEVLLEHASPNAIEKVAEQMIGKEAASSAFAKALQYVSPSFLETLIEKASKATDHNALKTLLPFMKLDDIQIAIKRACKKGSLATVTLLRPFAKTGTAGFCFKTLADQEDTPPELLEGLLPHMSQKAVLQIETDDLQESTCTAINDRIKGFAADIAFVHAFYVVVESYELDAVLEFSQKEAKKYNVELPQLCTTPEDCAENHQVFGNISFDCSSGKGCRNR